MYMPEGDLRVLVLDLPSNTKKFSVPLSKFVDESWTKEKVDNWQHGTLYYPVQNPLVIDNALFCGSPITKLVYGVLWEKAHIVIQGNRMLKCTPPI